MAGSMGCREKFNAYGYPGAIQAHHKVMQIDAGTEGSFWSSKDAS
jgi:hypothetical protein